MKRIVVGTDGSDSAAVAVEHAVAVAGATGADLVVVHGYGPPKAEGGPIGRTEAPPMIEIGKSILEDVERRHGKAVKIRGVLREGVDPADTIISVAEEEKADLIVVGNKGMTGAKRFLLGSVPNQVSHHAPCHVLIVKTT